MTHSNLKLITSTSNPMVQEIVDLKKSKKANQYLVEGFRAFETTYEQNKKAIKRFFITEEFTTSFPYRDIKDRCIVVSDSVMKKMSSMTTPPGILALCEYEYAKGVPTTPGLVCYEISDPGNLGSLFRTAAALSINTVICIGGVDPLNQKVIQASAGTINLLKIYKMTPTEFLQHAKSTETIALTVAGKMILNAVEKNKNRFLVIGNEAHGLPEDFLVRLTKSVTIPMQKSVDSLNAAIAGSIAMYQLF